MFGRFGWAEILVIVILVVILFGHSKVPGMMKNLADGINIFKRELKDTKSKSVVESAKSDADLGTQDAPVKKSSPKKPSVKKSVTKPVATKSPVKRSPGNGAMKRASTKKSSK